MALQQITVYENVTCDGCAQELTPVFDDSRVADSGVLPGQWRNLQGNDTLHVNLSSGYGEYLDLDIDHPSGLDFMLCSTCADKLLETFPAMKARLVSFEATV